MKKVGQLCVSILALMPAPLLAQGADGTDVGAPQSADTDRAVEAEGDIVITGSRLRQESVQDTPIAVAVMSAAQVEKLNATDIIGLSGKIPNLTVSTLGTAPNTPVISLRGFLTQAQDIAIEPGIPVYIDGVYQSTIAGSLSDMYDVERVEVLRGPQGTTLGKNASAGAVLVTRSRPTGRLEGRFNVEYGSYNLFQAQGLLNFPIIDGTLAGKVYAGFRRRDDWVENLAVPGGDMGGEKRGSVRGALLFTPTSDISYYLTGDYIWDRSSQLGGRSVVLPRDRICAVYNVCTPDLQVGKTRSGLVNKPTVDDINITGVGDWAFGGAKLSSITGFRKYEEVNVNDFDKTPFPALELHKGLTELEQFSQEVRLSSERGGLDFGGKLDWLIAGYYGHSNAYQAVSQISFGNPVSQAQRVIRDSYALFSHIDFHLTDELTLAGGVRHSWDTTRHIYGLSRANPIPATPTFSEEKTFENTSYEAGLQYKVAKDKMVYFRYAEGYRGGGFLGTPSSVANARSYDPETSRSYEIGAKTQWLDRSLQLNVTLFRTEFQNLQKQVGRLGANGSLIQVIDNAADAVIQGVEFESVLRPTHGLQIDISASYLDARYKEYISQNAAGDTIDLSDLPFQFAPKYTLSVAPQYEFNLAGEPMGFHTASISGRLTFSDEYEISSAVPPSPIGHQPSYETVDLSFDLRGDRFTLGAYVSNLFDKHYLLYGNEPANLIGFQVDNIGRTIGVKLGARF